MTAEMNTDLTRTPLSQPDGTGHFGPYALVLGSDAFNIANTPTDASLAQATQRLIA